MKRLANLSDEAIAKYQTTFKSVYLCQDTFLSASVAVGSILNTVDHVMKGKVDNSGKVCIESDGLLRRSI